MNRRKILSLALAAVVSCSVLAGCNKEKTVVDMENLGTKYGSDYPIKTEGKLSYWTNLTVHPDYGSYKEQPFFKAVQEQTGIDVEYEFAPQGQAAQAFNVLIASGDLPDIIMFDWYHLTGGAKRYIDQQYIIPLNEVFEKAAPNMRKYLDENPDIDRMIKTDDSQYYCFPFVRDSDWLTVYQGFIARKDLLDKYSLEVPETIDEWYNVLKTFKKNGVKYPLSFVKGVQGMLASAFGIETGYFLNDDGKVKYGAITDEYKEYMRVFKKWYEEGLIDLDFVSTDQTLLSSKVTSGDVGMTFNSGSYIGKWLQTGRALNSDFALVAVPHPTLEKGKKNLFGKSDFRYTGYSGGAITTACEDVELAARFLDYAYSEKGHLLYNFGIEGESFEMINGDPVYTDAMKSYKGGDMSSSIQRYIVSMGGSPCIQDSRMYKQRLSYKEQLDAIDTWSDVDADSSKRKLPLVTYTDEEQKTLSNIGSVMNTYVSEAFFKFIRGEMSLDKDYDAYVKEVKEIGVDEILKIRQAALDRYNNR